MAITINGNGSLTGITDYANSSVGKILQIVYAETTSGVSTYSTSYVDTNLTASITPSSSSSQILVIPSQTLSVNDNGGTYGRWRLLRGTTQIYADERTDLYNRYVHNTYTITYLDSPATTSSVTYKTQMSSGNGSYQIQSQHADLRTSTMILIEVQQ